MMRRLFQAKCVLTFLLACVTTAWAEKQYRSPEEFELYTRISKEFAANDFAKVLAGLHEWQQKFPSSDFSSNRQQLYVHAYARSGQAAKAIEAAKPALPGPFDTPDDQLRLLYAVVTAAPQVPSPTPEQREIVSEAARQLMAFDTMPAGTSAPDWQKARATLQATASVALLHTALAPIREAVQAKDCAHAEQEGRKVVQEFPDSAQASWVLASAQLCLARTMPEKFSSALFLLARATGLDPVKGFVDPAWQSRTAAPYLEKMYTQYHGADPKGLQELKEMALRSSLPPEGFKIASSAELEQKKQADLESKHPELALWLRIKAALSGPNGAAYFTSELKGVAVPALVGVVVQASPDCRPRQLMVSLADPTAPVAEILLSLSSPISGRPEAGSEVRFEGVATAFTSEPFLLTMTAEPMNVSVSKARACSSVGRKTRR